MAIATLPEGHEKSDFPFLNAAGSWGPSCQHEADCTIESHEYPAVEPPPYDRDGERTWAVFMLKVVRAGERNINEKFFVEGGNRLFRLLGGLGVHINDDGSYETDDLTGMKILIEAGDPRNNKDGDPAYSSIKTLQAID